MLVCSKKVTIFLFAFTTDIRYHVLKPNKMLQVRTIQPKQHVVQQVLWVLSLFEHEILDEAKLDSIKPQAKSTLNYLLNKSQT